MPELTVIHHWLNEARHLRSPNCNQRPNESDIALIVVHGISLPPRQFGTHAIEKLFTNQLCHKDHPYFETLKGLKVSSHVLIDRSGQITQFVGFDQRAWHAGNSQFCHRDNCNDFSIGIELEGCDDLAYEPSQYQTLIKLIHALYQAYPNTRENPVVGHCHIAPGRKTDPGDSFEWQRLRSEGILVWSD